ncbi:DUF4125 family protein [Demequina flava]|uniref:DUF4125 family protein n=1 Tax=Demequina flava TaxID=1095025 RepID=UPI000782772B|nr:DUF4125 family protein [Demequina flava]
MDRDVLAERLDLAEGIVRHEFTQMGEVPAEGGRAACQDDWLTFHGQRLPQFLTWPVPLLTSYAADLDAADAAGRNLLTEKYARMMASMEPERYAREIAPRLPVLAEARVAAQERVIGVQVEWARDFHSRFPCLGAGMRVLRTAQDTLEATSFETYLRGELGTYSDATFALYADLVDEVATRGGNLTEETLTLTVALAGLGSLDEAEAAQTE